MTGVDMAEVHARARREQAAAENEADPGFAAIVEAAAARGYRKATIGEIHASAERRNGATDLFCWKGGLWARTEGAAQ